MIFVLVDIVILSIAAAFESLRFHPESLDDKENDDIINVWLYRDITHIFMVLNEGSRTRVV